ncbi:TVP38/TMEM64 family protein [Gemmatimonas sp.]|uniref:TVP38/TMEM64 family protein n=1 Tax=Gemmatimonas sp. TaxID=1962908 RepID=UPI00286E7998|nr:TVP38/TMEM64 family protein [Gemmatimonas sp.]
MPLDLKSAATGLMRAAGIAVPLVVGIAIGQLATPYLPGFSVWVQTLGAWAPLAFVAAYIGVVLFMLPAFLLTMAGGAVFGVVKGSALVLAGATIGGTLAFLLGRTVLRASVARRVAAHPTLSAVDRVIGDDGLRLMFLLRLSPAIPFVLSNYALGVTRVRTRDFVMAMPGMLPIIASYAAFGAAGAKAANGKGALPMPVLMLGVVATVVLGLLFARMTQKALRDAEAQAQAQAR